MKTLRTDKINKAGPVINFLLSPIQFDFASETLAKTENSWDPKFILPTDSRLTPMMRTICTIDHKDDVLEMFTAFANRKIPVVTTAGEYMFDFENIPDSMKANYFSYSGGYYYLAFVTQNGHIQMIKNAADPKKYEGIKVFVTVSEKKTKEKEPGRLTFSIQVVDVVAFQSRIADFVPNFDIFSKLGLTELVIAASNITATGFTITATRLDNGAPYTGLTDITDWVQKESDGTPVTVAVTEPSDGIYEIVSTVTTGDTVTVAVESTNLVESNTLTLTVV